MGFVWFVLAVVAAVWFYWLRCRQRNLYGTSEVVVGLLILAAKFIFPQADLLAIGGGSEWNPSLALLITLFTGIYAIVRGLDNIFSEEP